MNEYIYIYIYIAIISVNYFSLLVYIMEFVFTAR